MKKGDVVTVHDGSYSRSIINDKLIHEIGTGQSDEKFTVIETGCSFPNTGSIQLLGPIFTEPATFNNTVIQAIDSGKVVFIEERFLHPVPPKHMIIIDAERKNCVVIGAWVEISDKLYQEIKHKAK